MSTSLNKDLHSVYIDGEMPESFVSQYEKLVASNEEEKKNLEKFQALHSMLKADSSEKTVSDAFLEESFNRLQTKMRYAKTVSLSSEPKNFVTPFIKYASAFTAAAAVFALVFIPVHYNSLSNAKQTAVAAISITKQNSIEPIAKKDVVIDGNLNKEDLPKYFAKAEDTKSEEKTQVEQKTIYATNLAANYGNGFQRSSTKTIDQRFCEKLTSVDPFIPDFSSSSISISVPNFHEIGNNMEIMDFPNETGSK